MTEGEGSHWFEPVAEHLGEAYLRYSFTKGTVTEVDGLIELTGLAPGASVLDVGCGPGRHALELARRGYRVHGVDISSRFVDLAKAGAEAEGLGVTFEVADARRLDFNEEFDLVVSLCQGAFGLTGGPAAPAHSEVAPDPVELDEGVLAAMAQAVQVGGTIVVSAFSAYFQVRYLEDHDSFDAANGVNQESTSVKNPEGVEAEATLWTTCYTPRELRLLARTVGLEPVAVHGASPGRYRAGPCTIDDHEFLLLARRP